MGKLVSIMSAAFVWIKSKLRFGITAPAAESVVATDPVFVNGPIEFTGVNEDSLTTRVVLATSSDIAY